MFDLILRNGTVVTPHGTSRQDVAISGEAISAITSPDAIDNTQTKRSIDVNGKIVAIVDDMISTGGTICRASEALLKQGAKEVHAACTHGLFTGGAINRLSNHVNGVHSTDSLPNPKANVSAAPALARGVMTLMDQIN